MLQEATVGTVFKVHLRKSGSSYIVTLPPAVKLHLAVELGEPLAIKLEISKKYGKYIGIGKLQTEEAVEEVNE